MTAADPLDRAETAPEPPPEEAPAVEVVDPEAVFEAAAVGGEFTVPDGFARPVPAPGICAAFCAAAGSASTRLRGTVTQLAGLE